MAEVDVRYRLPLTVVRVTGTKTVVTNDLATPDEMVRKTRVSSMTLEVRADPRSVHTLRLEAAAWSRLQATVNILPDGRITGASATFTNKSAGRWSAGVSAAASTAGAVAPFLAPLGAPGIAAAAAVALAAAAATVIRVDADIDLNLEPPEGSPPPERPEPPRPGFEALGIRDEYKSEIPSDADALATYRWSIALLQARHAYVASRTRIATRVQARTMKDLELSLASARRGAARLELAYAEWLASTTHTTVTHVDDEFRIDEVPDTEGLDDLLSDPPQSGENRWWDLARQLRSAVTCDYADGHGETGDESLISCEDGEVLYRQPRFATITSWKLSLDEDGNRKWVRTLDSVVRALVTAPGTADKVALVTPGGDDRSMTVSFDASGALTQVTSDRTDARVARADGVTALPAVMRDAFAAGGALAAPFVPPTELQQAKDDVELADAQKKLNALRHPAPPDPLADLRDQVTGAELAARLASAEHTVHDPADVQFIVTVTG